MIAAIVGAIMIGLTAVAICAAVTYRPDDEQEGEDDERRSD